MNMETCLTLAAVRWLPPECSDGSPKEHGLRQSNGGRGADAQSYLPPGSKPESSHPGGRWMLLQRGTLGPLTLAIQATGAVVPDCPNGKGQTFTAPFYVWTFPLLEHPRTASQMWPCARVTLEQLETVPRPIQLTCLISAFVTFSAGLK